ncbi:MAG: class I SAM-dependent methyltransferase [Gemmatimonadota bacterium]|nr:class I SAM-dependent methyltransferase [Gemmatimonadota bacterium]
MSEPAGHPVRGRLNAWLLSVADDAMHREYGDRKVRLLGDLPDTVVELGPGAGANFRYYPRGTRVIAVEPNPAMHGRLRARARERGIDLDLRDVRAEGLPVGTATAELVVATLVLCTVGDPERVVAEVRRILRPGGRFAFLEHVAAPRGTPLRRFQAMIRRPWRWLGEGCHLDRDTASTLGAAGFTSLELERFRAWSGRAPFAPHIAGVAVR